MINSQFLSKCICIVSQIRWAPISASKIGLPTPCRVDVALQYANIGSSVNSSSEPWAPTGEERAIVPATLPATPGVETRLLTDDGPTYR